MYIVIMSAYYLFGGGCIIMAWYSISTRGKWYYILYPRPVVVVSASADGCESAMAASWCSPVSRDPPLVMVAIAPTRYTYELIKSSGEFAINILDYRFCKEVNFLGIVSGRDYPDKIERSKLHKIKAKKIKAPIISESTAVLECKLYKEISLGGDHVMVIGKVIEAYAKEPLKGIPDIKSYRTLLQLAGTTYTTTITSYIKQ